MASFKRSLVLFFLFRVLVVESMLNFQYMACANPWYNFEFFTNTYYPVTDETCFELCRNHRFVFIRDRQCSCADTVNRESGLNILLCNMESINPMGGSIGSEFYCNTHTDACQVLLTGSQRYPSIEAEAVDCLGTMCGTLDDTQNVPSMNFSEQTPQDCIEFCAFQRKAYAYYRTRLIEWSPPDEYKPLGYCRCLDSATVIETDTQDCGNLLDHQSDDVNPRWSIYCTTKYFPGNSSCLTMYQFPEKSFGNKEEICRPEQPVTSTTVETTITMIATTAQATTTTDSSTTSNTEQPITSTTVDTTTTMIATTTQATTTTGSGEICYCSDIDSYDQSWNVTAGDTGLQDCPLNQTGQSSWTCGSGSKGECHFITKQPNYSDCHSQWLGDLETDIEDGKDVLSILQKLDSQTNITNNYYGHEIEGIVDTLQDILELERTQSNSSDPDEVLSRAVKATERGTSVLNNLITHEDPWDQIEENRTGAATKILNGSEVVGMWLSEVSRSVKKSLNCGFQFPGILLGSIGWDLEFQDIFPCDLQVFEKDPLMKQVQFPSLNNSDSHISWASSSTTRTYHAVGVLYNSTIIAGSFPGSKNTFGESERDKQINSQVLSYMVLGDSIKDMKVNLVFRHQREAKNPPVKNLRRRLRPNEEPSSVIGSSVCSFIQFSSGNGEDWTWDNKGCVVQQTNRTHTVCECNHLTSFANLMNIHKYNGPDAGLELTSMICSSLSVLSLFFTIVLLSSLRLIRNDRTAITQNLCLCLMVSHLLILNVFDRKTYNFSNEVCAAFGIILHYTLLASFTWMVVEGLRLCHVIVDPFRTGSDKMVIYYCIGYGVPLVIVLVTVIVAATSAGGVTAAYAQDETCWLRVDDYIWSYSGPIAAILLLNLLCLIFAVVKSSRLEVNKRRKLDQQIRSTASMTLSLSILLGLTWILGYFIFSETPVFAYLFTIVNGLQGVLIFVFRCVLNEPVRMAVRRTTKRTKQSLTLRMQLQNSNRNQSKISRTQSESTSPPPEGRPPFTGAQINEILTRRTSESGTSGVCRPGTSIDSIDSAWSSMGRKDSAFPDEVSVRSDDHLDYHRYSFDSFSENYN